MSESGSLESEILGVLERLVGFDTVSDKTNLDAIAWIEAYAHQSLNVRTQRYFNDTKDKAALVIQIGPENEGGVVLSGHIEVVPVAGQAWDHDPFSLTRRGEHVFGRGTCDMKGFLAVALSAIPELSRAGLTRPVQIAISYDEEVGCLGAPPLIEGLLADFPRADSVIVGEPTGMKSVIGHKGVQLSETIVRGYEVHSSHLHRGVSAIHVASKLIAWHDRQNDQSREATSAFSFDPPFSTFHVGLISGGTASNITARDCRFTSDWRLLPGCDADELWDRYVEFAANIESEIRKIADTARVTVVKGPHTPPLDPKGVADGAPPFIPGYLDRAAASVVSYGTEAGHFQRSGFNTLICGPGSIRQAHQENEYIAISELLECRKFFRNLACEMS